MSDRNKPYVDLTRQGDAPQQRSVQEGIDRLRKRLGNAHSVGELRDVMKGVLDLLADMA